MDEASAESFPASDPPSWTAAHLGAPWSRPRVAEHHELRALLRADVERLARVSALSRGDEASRRGAMEDLVARGLLEAGRAVMRQPIDAARSVRNVEAEIPGASRGAEPVVIAALYDGADSTGTAFLLALARELALTRLARTTRLLAFARGGSAPFVDRLRSGPGAHAILALEDLDLARSHPEGGLVLVGNWRSRRMLRGARRAFGLASRVPAGALALPAWLPRVAAAEHTPLWRAPWPAVLVADDWPWRSGRHRPLQPDVDRMAAAVPGLVSLIARLAGGRA